MSTDPQDMARDEFLEAAMQPEFPDRMAYQIDRAYDPGQPDATFSQEAVDALAEQFRTFLMARVVAYRTSRGRSPLLVRAMVDLDWAPDDPKDGDAPFYHIERDPGLEPFDPSRRKWKEWN